MASNHSLSLSAVALVLLLTVLPTRGQHPAVPPPVPLAGLIESVEIIRDRWGIPHIYAKNEHDLFFVQGYNAARDRLFQFEIWRRQATGRWLRFSDGRNSNETSARGFICSVAT